jgi:hypothetical protein
MGMVVDSHGMLSWLAVCPPSHSCSVWHIYFGMFCLGGVTCSPFVSDPFDYYHYQPEPAYTQQPNILLSTKLFLHLMTELLFGIVWPCASIFKDDTSSGIRFFFFVSFSRVNLSLQDQ